MLKLINKFFLNSFFPIGLKYISLFFFVVLIYFGFKASSTDEVFLKELRNTNIANLIVWSYWWPIIILTSIFFGRLWCMVCPVEVITTFFAKIGFKLKRPKFIISGWVITIFYVVILFVGIGIFAIHRNPFFMSLYLLLIVIVSIVIGLLFEKNTFCRYVCPVGYLLGIYSRLSFLGWRVKSKEICELCKDKSCINKNNLYNLNAKSCGVDLYPAKISDNSNCILCAGCLKACNKYKTQSIVERPNPQFVKIGFANDLFKIKPLKWSETIFLLIVSGFVVSEILSEWNVTNNILNYLPNLITETFKITNIIFIEIIHSTIIFLAYPLIVWLLPYLISKIYNVTISFKDYMLLYGLSFIPIIASAHLCKAVLKTTSRIPYFKYVFNDMTGISTANKIISKQIILLETPFWLNILITILMILFIVTGIVISVIVVSKTNKYLFVELKSKKTYYLIPVIYGSIFLFTILFWRLN